MNAPGRDAPLILLIEDDAAVRRMERLVLTTAGFGIAEAADGETALRLLHEQRADAAVLAINRNAEPRAVDTLRAIKAQADTPVIIMSADTDTESRIECIAAGADDGLDKPFAPARLEQQVRFLLRGEIALPDAADAVRVGDLLLDMSQQAVFRHGRMIRLGLGDWTLLELLVEHNGEGVLHRELLTRALGRTHARDIDLLRACIDRLRRKIDSSTSGSKIVDFHGVGYALGYAPLRPPSASGIGK
jgi:DNA-binding response OmpR family regulator